MHTKPSSGKHMAIGFQKKITAELYFASRSVQRTSDKKVINKFISQVGECSGIISFKWANLELHTFVSFVLHTACLYTCWAGHLAQRIRMLTSLHSAHSFWNDSIFLILFSFRVCGFEAIWHPFFQSRILWGHLHI